MPSCHGMRMYQLIIGIRAGIVSLVLVRLNCVNVFAGRPGGNHHGTNLERA